MDARVPSFFQFADPWWAAIKTQENSNTMKLITRFAAIAAILACLAFLSGCDPTKPGGGNQPQRYDPGNGQYK